MAHPTTPSAALKAPREPELLQRLRAELRCDPELLADAERLFKPAPTREPILIRTDAASVDAAIARAFELAVEGLHPNIHLEE
ncbi:MAG TPA: hypothetical protein VIX19_10825 [Terriglobales bacterium]